MICKVTRIEPGVYALFINHFRKFTIRKSKKKNKCSGNFSWNIFNIDKNEIIPDFISLQEAKEYCLAELLTKKERKHA
jgi:hypothetical protein